MTKAINLGKNDGKKADKATTPNIITVQSSLVNLTAEQLESLRAGDIVKVEANHIDYYCIVSGVTPSVVYLYYIYGDNEELRRVKWTKAYNNWTYQVTMFPLRTQTYTISGGAATQQVEDNAIYNAGELSALTITLPGLIDTGFISQFNFTSGSTATQLTAPNTIVWTGDDLDDGVFVPAANRRYVVMFHYDGVNVRGVVQGIDIVVTP